ncbi:MAG: nucleotide sugar dehydrogenase [Sphingomonadaceae bacterium]|nr:nucleotide sugar dehydrogenase [Sphingomonadaceae bacterium]
MVDESLRLVVVGLGYVGLPLAVALARHFPVTGLDIDAARIAELRAGHDRTGEISAGRLADSALAVTSDPEECRGFDVYIVTVPTPVDRLRRPDLAPLMSATGTVAGLIAPGGRTLVIYESTVYPGLTEDVCGPEIERAGGLVRGRDFVLGYSPERINPGDREHVVDRIVKVVSGEDAETLARVSAIYDQMTTGGTFAAASIKAAEAAKVIENAQRDINIAFVNEITQIFAEIDLSIWDVLAAARTKWNFLDFQPGLVGGHCIGVDPYYLAHVATEHDRDPRVVLAGRATNDGMGAWIAERLHDRRGGKAGSALVLGLTFKENVPDIRNSKVIDLIRRLHRLGHRMTLHDPLADPQEFKREYDLALRVDALGGSYDLVVCAVAHAEYRAMTSAQIVALTKPDGLVADLKGIWADRELPARWSL